MILSQKKLHLYKLPLAIAVSSAILTGCSTTTPTNNQVGNLPNTNTLPNNPSPSQNVSKVPASNIGYSTALLDDESLEELADLLEATDMTMVEDDKLAIQQYGNLWDRLRAGFAIDQSKYQYNPRIEAQKSWFATRQDYINRLTARASRYLYHTVSEAERRNIPTELALLPVIESSYDPTATSNASAAGLWQFIPSTGRIYGLAQTSSYDGRRDVIESTRAAYDFLTSLYNQFGSWELALAAYNAGPGRVQKAIDANVRQGLPTDFWSLNLPQETKNYVPRFLAVSQIVADSNSYNMYLPAIANRQHFRSVPVNYGVSLDEVSRLTGVSYEELRMLNPALVSGQVDAAGPNRVIVPNQVNMTVDAKLSQLSGNGVYNASIPQEQYEQIIQTPEGLAEFAAKAKAPTQNSQYIAPNPIYPSHNGSTPNGQDVKVIESELKTANSLPTTSARVTSNATVIQEPPLTQAEKDFIAAQIKSQSPDVGEVVSTKDGNVKLEAIQTQQSVLSSKGEDKRLSFATPANAPKPTGKRTIYTVQPGDTLSDIAARAGLNWRDIAKWNQINASETLLAGSTLYLYGARPMSTSSNASSGKSSIYTVQKGDTLIGTAAKFGISVTNLASYNGIATNAQLYEGQKLWLIPGKSGSSPSTAANNTYRPSQPTTTAYTGKTQSYKIQRGDTLTALAARYNVPLSTLAAMNGMSRDAQLVANQRLIIPATVSTSTSQPSRPTSNYNGVSTTYKVQSGDTLIGIANQLDVSRTQIAQMNDFSANAQLQEGQRIKLPASSEQVALQLKGESVKYKVQSGDTLIGVANRYGVSVSDLAAANNLTTKSQLIRDTTITIPSGPVSTSRSPSKPASSPSARVAYSGDYKVQSGDTLIGLAKEFGVSVSDLAAANGLSTNAQLRTNQKLKVPAAVTQSSPRPTAAASSTSGNYTVKSGDSLIALAKKNGLTVKQLANANDLSTNAQLIIGQKITIPATTTAYKVRTGDTLIGLAKRYGMTPQELAKLNGIDAKAMLKIGQTLKVPLQ